MSFDLRITLTGLCFFLTETEKRELWILMPASPANSGNGRDHDHHDHAHGEEQSVSAGAVDQHFAKLMYDRGYENPDPDRRLKRDVACVSLDHRELILGSADWWHTAPPTPLNLMLTDEIINLDREHDKVDRQVLGVPPLDPPILDKLNARLKLEAGCLCDYAPGIVWEIGYAKRLGRLTYKAEWVIRNIPGNELNKLELTALDQTRPPLLPTLYPIGDTIRLDILHLPSAKLPPNTVTGAADGRHIHYYEVLSQDYQNRQIPWRADGFELYKVDCPPPAKPLSMLGAIPLECMFGGGVLP